MEQWASRYPERRRKQLFDAHSRIQLNGLEKCFAKVACFVKNETSTKATDPRNISPRMDEFLVTLGPFISALEHAAIDCKYLVKGLNILNRNEKMNFLSEFGSFIETDYSRYDSTISPEVMRLVEGAIFRYCFPPDIYPEFDKALKYCEKTSGTTLFGWKYNTTGRCSGDAHTSIGNGLINRFNTWVSMKNLPPESWSSSHEGDDGILGCDNLVLNQVLTNTMLFGGLGFQIKLFSTDNISLAGFCGRTLFFTPLLDSMCDVRRTLSKFHITCCQLPGRRAVLAKALSYWSTDNNTPIVGVLCYVLISLLKPDFRDRRAFSRTQSISNFAKTQLLVAYDELNLCCPQPSAQSRCALQLKENISIHIQQSFEDEILSWLILGFIPSHFPVIIDIDPHVDDERTTYYGHSYPNFM
jgi:hypothetical protein